MLSDREFQRVGVVMVKALSPKVRYLVLVVQVTRMVSAEWREKVEEW